MGVTQLRGSNQVIDTTIPLSKLVADFLAGIDWNITNGNNNATITGLANGVLDNDAVNMSQFNMALEGLKQKFYARTISPTTNVTISGPQTVDGVNCVDGDLVLLGGQTTVTEDGLYIVRAGAWERADYWNVGDEVGAYTVSIQEGDTFDNTGWIVTNNKGSDIVGTDDLVLLQTYGPGAVGARNGLSMSGSDVILGGQLNQDTYIYGNLTRLLALKDLTKYYTETTNGNSFEMNYYGSHPGIRMRSASGAEFQMSDQNGSGITTLINTINNARLDVSPDGTVPLAIATVDYVNNAGEEPIFRNEQLTVTDGSAVLPAVANLGTSGIQRIKVFKNGALQNPGAGNDYTVDLTTGVPTMALPLVDDGTTADVILVEYQQNNS